MTRILGLGNEILADDAFGILVAREAERRFPGQVEAVCSSSSGFALLDDVVGAQRLLVVDTIQTVGAEPGSIRVFTSERFQPAAAVGPHFMGLFETLAAARELGMDAPEEVLIIAVEAADCITVGGPMHPKVRTAIPEVVELIGRLLGSGWPPVIPGGL